MDREDAAVIATFESGLAKVPEVRDSERLRSPRLPRPRSHRRHSRLSEPLFADISGPSGAARTFACQTGYSRDSLLADESPQVDRMPFAGQGRAHRATSLAPGTRASALACCHARVGRAGGAPRPRRRTPARSAVAAARAGHGSALGNRPRGEPALGRLGCSHSARKEKASLGDQAGVAQRPDSRGARAGSAAAAAIA
jgi:hypothetical protein